MIARLIVIGLALLGLTANASALPPQTRTALEALFAEQGAPDAPGLAMGVVRDGEVVFEAYGGLADLNHGVPIDAQTRFNIASNTKQYAALAVLELVEAGEIDLGADIRTYLADALPGIEAEISIAQLIVHESGLRDSSELWGLQGRTWWRHFFGNDDAMELLNAQTDLNFAPGTDAIYSNSNYTVLAELVAAVSGQSFADYSADMFDRLGMENSRYRTSSFAVVPNVARPYGNFGSWAEYPTITSVHGDGALYTTLGDQLTYERALQSEDRSALLTLSQGRVPGAQRSDYGFGLELGGFEDLPVIHHEGSTGAYNAFFLRFPGEDLAIVVMSNNAGLSPRSIGLRAAQLILGEERFSGAIYRVAPGEIGLSPALAYAQPNDTTLIRVTLTEGVLSREIEGRDPVVLNPVEGNVFEYASLEGLFAVFGESEAGSYMELIYPTQSPSRYYRIPDADFVSREIEFSGRFINAEIGAEIILSDSEEGPVMTLNGNTSPLEPATARRFIANGSVLELDVDADGQITGFALNWDRIRNVAFARVP